jgi:hypothetical protein
MPITVLNDAAATTITGGVTIAKDQRTGDGGNFSVSGTVSVSGAASFASGLTASSISAGGINLSVASGFTITGGLTYDVVTGGLPASTTSSQSLSTGSQINMTSGVSVGGAHVVYVSANSTTATVALTPTTSTATSGVFQNGLEVTVINLAPSGSNVLLPTSSAGVAQQNVVTISAGKGVKFVYIANANSWVPVSG